MTVRAEQAEESLRETTVGAQLGSRVKTVVRGLLVAGAIAAMLLLSASSVPSDAQQRRAALTLTVAGSTFSITGWMAQAMVQKLETTLTQPTDDLSLAAGADLVRAYLDRAQAIADLERQIERAFSRESDDEETLAAMQTTLDDLRAEQRQVQPRVEQVIERQVSAELAAAGVTTLGRTFPPVQFTFSEPPKKLVVSPRDRIATTYYRMVVPAFSTEAAERTEAVIHDEHDLSAYVTQIGGMGAWPAMVVDRASLPWVISTVAHEWTHNYLFLFPLGLSYNRSPELTIINETVAEIVGNEIGQRVLERYYPEWTQTEEAIAELLAAPRIPVIPFDFRREMRTTRLTVDALLAEGKVDEAEAYMERRRQFFVANGYPLRVLNQAYFAFHGSYGTSAASSDPLGPKLFQLRALNVDVATFLRSVRNITSAEAFERVYAQQTVLLPPAIDTPARVD